MLNTETAPVRRIDPTASLAANVYGKLHMLRSLREHLDKPYQILEKKTEMVHKTVVYNPLRKTATLTVIKLQETEDKVEQIWEGVALASEIWFEIIEKYDEY